MWDWLSGFGIFGWIIGLAIVVALFNALTGAVA